MSTGHFQEAIGSRATHPIGHNQGLGNQLIDGSRDIVRADVRVGYHCQRGVDREGADEDGQPLQHDPLDIG